MLVEERPDLYDHKRPGHANVNVVEALWKEIGAQIP